MLLGAPIQTVPEQAQAVNPITYVTSDAPPFLIQHGTADCNVPPQQGQLLYDALQPAIGAENVTYTFWKAPATAAPSSPRPPTCKSCSIS